MTQQVCIILTTTVHVTPNSAFQVDKNERIQTYLLSIKKWIYQTNLNIIVVENSGYFFPELQKELELYKDRFELFVYNEAKTDEMHLMSKGGLEISSIHYAYENSNLIKNTLFIIKITGRFFISSFQEFIQNINLNEYDVLKQHFNSRCEIVGTHINNFKIIFDKNLFCKGGKYDYIVENVYDYRFTLFKKIIICPIFNIEKTQRGGLNECYTIL